MSDRLSREHANELSVQAVRSTLDGGFNGRIVLHCADGRVRKIER